MSKPEFLWTEAVEIAVGRTDAHRFKLWKPNKKAAAIAAGAVVRFKLSDAPDLTPPLLDIDSVSGLAGGSIVEIIARGTDEVTPAEVIVHFCQDDTADLNYKKQHYGEIGVVDTDETIPSNAFKRAGYGPVNVKPSQGGNVGIIH